jgi:putative membrane protein
MSVPTASCARPPEGAATPAPRAPAPGGALKFAIYIGGVLGLSLLALLLWRADWTALLQLASIGGLSLLWLVPYRALYFLLYALGWRRLLRPYDPGARAGLAYVLWVTTVREAVDRLLPVASVGGAFVGIRLLRWRGLAGVAVAATVIIEVLLTVVALYVFTALGVLLLAGLATPGQQYRRLITGLLLGLPVPALLGLLLRYGSVFRRLAAALGPLLGIPGVAAGAAALDEQLRACLQRRAALTFAGALQLLAFLSASFEVWFLLRLFGHPVGIVPALIMESLMQALRHAAFMVPAALGVQEAGLIVLGHALGITPELALAVSLGKRLRELLCGLPALLSWQWLEGRRLRTLSEHPS